MKTTDLFAEMIVVGIGTLAALLLGLLALVPSLAPTFRSVPSIMAIPALALAYLLGIITDRIADAMFERRAELRRVGPELTHEDYKVKKVQVLQDSPRALANEQYARSRLRVVRGWFLNSILLAIASVAYLLSTRCEFCTGRTAIIVGAVFVGLAVACFCVRDKLDDEEVKVVNRLHTSGRTTTEE